MSAELDSILSTIQSVEQRIVGTLAESQGDSAPARIESLKALATGLEMLRVVSDELSARTEALSTLRESYVQLFNNAAEARLVTDRDGIILEANAAAGKLFERAPRTLIGKALWLYLREDGRKAFLRRFALFNAGIEESGAWIAEFLGQHRKVIAAEIRLTGRVDSRGGAKRLYWGLAAPRTASSDTP
jgi:PAS domain S-box-containing protein